ncbi:beta-ketoacyl synthase N-terminal-like domain-containing protein [Kitasatospora xanthocidica]|uniref:beta-ketoacyl synthase N-terminal-like domain-containing protein n=1 Tax=Kitasatospora xanthocidica TaxID=83382 RepID=UPI0036F00E5C
MTAAAPATTGAGPVGAAGDELVLTAWSAVTPFGLDRAEFGAGVLAGRSAVGELDREQYPGPYARAGLVPGFSAAEALGRKGTRTMDRVTALAVTAVDRLIAECGPGLLERPERVGLVLGTGHGSVQSIMDFTRDSLTGEKPYHVDPARFPNTVMNRAAGQSAIWHGIKGPNSTIAGGRLTGLLALNYAARLHRGGHCDQVICGAAEEYSVQRAWLEWAGGTGTEELGEGGTVVLLESAAGAAAAGRRPLARLLGVRFRAHQGPGTAGAALTACVRAALEQAGRAAGEVRLVAPLGGDEEWDAVVEALGGAAPRRLDCRPLTGDTAAAATSLQLAAVLASVERGELSEGQLALVTGTDRDGQVGCAVLGV